MKPNNENNGRNNRRSKPNIPKTTRPRPEKKQE